MAFLKQIVEEINSQLASDLFTGNPYQGSVYYSLAEMQRRAEDTDRGEVLASRPVIVDENLKECELSDENPLTIYHRQITSTFKEDENSAGNSNNIIETSTMMMIVMGDRKRLQTTPDTLCSAIASNMIQTITSVSRQALKLYSCEIRPVQAYLDKEVVWQNEYRLTECPLGAEWIYFGIQYQIESSYQRGCFTICRVC